MPRIALCEFKLGGGVGEAGRFYVGSIAAVAQAAETDARAERRQTAHMDHDWAGDIKALRGVPGMRLRVGDWRVLFTTTDDTVLIHAVGHRRDIYE